MRKLDQFIISDVKALDSLLSDFYNIIKVGPKAVTGDAERIVFVMKRNIATVLRKNNPPEDLILELLSELRSAYYSMFHSKGGLSEFYIWDDNFEIRKKKNMEYEQIKSMIERILNMKR